MLALSKSSQFDMTLMFVENKERSYIDSIVAKIRTKDAAKADQVNEAYDD